MSLITGQDNLTFNLSLQNYEIKDEGWVNVLSFVSEGTSTIVKAQGAYLTSHEIQRLIKNLLKLAKGDIDTYHTEFIEPNFELSATKDIGNSIKVSISIAMDDQNFSKENIKTTDLVVDQ